MKKVVSSSIIFLLALCAMLALTGCSISTLQCDITYLEAQKVKITSSDAGIDEISASGNTITAVINKEGTYSVTVDVDGNEETLEITRTKSGMEAKGESSICVGTRKNFSISIGN